MRGYTRSVNVIIVFSEFDLCMQSVVDLRRSTHYMCMSVVIKLIENTDNVDTTQVSALLCSALLDDDQKLLNVKRKMKKL